MTELGVGMVGYGFIGRVHTHAYLTLPLYYDPAPAKVRLVGVCDVDERAAAKGVDQAGFEFATTNYHDLLARDDIQIINCCTPNFQHKELLIDALRAGKHIYCDKPLALNLEEAQEICQLAKTVKTVQQMNFECRNSAAMLRAKQLVEQGFLGDVFSFRGGMFHSGYVDPNRPMSWRTDFSKSGGGAIVDLGAHVIDLVRHLLGEFKQVFACTRTFIKERPAEAGSSQMVPVEVDDITWMQIEMENSAVGTLEASRLATGSNDDIKLEIHGNQGALAYDHMDPNWLYVYDNTLPEGELGGNRGFTKIETVQRYPKPVVLPSPKFSVGWMRFHVAGIYDFLKAIVEGNPANPSFEDGLAVHRIIDASLRSAQQGKWLEV